MKHLDERSQYKIRRMKEIAPKEGFEYSTTRNDELCASFESIGHGLNEFGYTKDPYALPCEIIHNLGGEIIDVLEINNKVIVIFNFENDKLCKY